MIEESLRSHLLADATLAGIIGDRVYPYESVAQGAPLPFITYYEVSGVPENTLDGTGSLINSRFQIDCYADTKAGLFALRNAVKAAMLADTAYITKALLVNRNDVGWEMDTQVFRYSMDFSIWHYE